MSCLSVPLPSLHFPQQPLQISHRDPVHEMLHLLHLLQFILRAVEGAEKAVQDLVAVQQVFALPQSLFRDRHSSVFLKVNVT